MIKKSITGICAAVILASFFYLIYLAISTAYRQHNQTIGTVEQYVHKGKLTTFVWYGADIKNAWFDTIPTTDSLKRVRKAQGFALIEQYKSLNK